MDERLKEVEKFLDDDNKEAEAIIGKLNKLRPKERIEWLQDWTQKADKIYNGAPELKPRDLQKLLDKFRVYKIDGTQHPLRKDDYKDLYNIPMFKAFPEPPLDIKRFNSKVLQNSNLDKVGTKVSGSTDKQEFADKFNRDIEEQTQGSNPRAANQPMGNNGLLNESRIVSLNGQMTDYELNDILKDLENKTDQTNLIIKGGSYSLVLENSKQDWENKINELQFLKELYPIWENISEILERPATARAGDNHTNVKDKSDTITPANYKGELKEDCEKDLRELLREKAGDGLEPFFKAAQTRYPSCRKAIKKEVDGKVKENDIGWSTLRNRVEEDYPDIYKKVKSR